MLSHIAVCWIVPVDMVLWSYTAVLVAYEARFPLLERHVYVLILLA